MQVRQVRLSPVSSAHGYLPFGCHHVETTDIRSVVQPLVFDDWNNPRYMCFEESDATDEFDTDDECDADADETMYAEKRFLRVAGIALG